MCQIIGEVGRAVFLIAAQQEPDVFPQGNAGGFDSTEGVQHCHSRSLVVNGTSAVNAVVSDLGSERVGSPVRLYRRNHVQVAQNSQMRRQRVVPVSGSHVVVIVGAGHAQCGQLFQHKVQSLGSGLAIGKAILRLRCGNAGKADQFGKRIHGFLPVGVNVSFNCFRQHKSSFFRMYKRGEPRGVRGVTVPDSAQCRP